MKGAGRMSNEEFQKKILDQLEIITKSQDEIRKDLRAVVEQTAQLTEFRAEINNKVDKLTEELNTIEIVTSKNWNDIAKLKSVK